MKRHQKIRDKPLMKRHQIQSYLLKYWNTACGNDSLLKKYFALKEFCKLPLWSDHSAVVSMQVIMSRLMTKPTKWHVRPAKTQISLGIRSVWSESQLLLNGQLRTQAFFMWTAKTLIRLGGCPGWSMSSLGTHHFVGFLMRQLLLFLFSVPPPPPVFQMRLLTEAHDLNDLVVSGK